MKLKASVEPMKIKQPCWFLRRKMAISMVSFLKCFKMYFAGWIDLSKPSSEESRREINPAILVSKAKDGPANRRKAKAKVA